MQLGELAQLRGGLPERERVADWAHTQIRGAILQGALPPGDRLSVPALARELHVSRSPVREAVQRLVREGLAEDVPHRGAVVASVGVEELAHVYQVREPLEGLAARLAAQLAADTEFVDRLRSAFRDHEAAVQSGDVEAHVDADMRFHRLIRERTGNTTLIAFLDQIQGSIQLAMLTTSVTGGMEQALAEHRVILDAIERGDPAAAEVVARRHVARLRGVLRVRSADEQVTA